MVEEINSAQFMPKVLAADGKVLVEFFATWCPHCQRMEPIVEQISLQQPDIPIYKVDVDKELELANTYAPDGFPTFVVFDEGEVMRQATGEQTIDYLEAMLDF